MPNGEASTGPDEIAARAEAMLAAQRAGGEVGPGEDVEDLGMARAQQRSERPRTAGRRPPKVTSKVKESSEQTAAAAVAAPTIIAEGTKDDDDDDDYQTA